MYYVSEAAVRDAVTQDDVTETVRHAFLTLAEGEASNWPIVREVLGYADAIFGFKSGFDRAERVLGAKAGGLWPGNRAKGLANHQSTILLFDPETGGPHALVRGTYLTALRTAAASALSIRHLARADAKALGIVGAGGQAEFQISAALKERDFETLYIHDQAADAAEQLKATLDGLGLDMRIASAEETARHSDVIITVTPSFSPVLEAAWIRPGTHLACMGADTKGKQEVETDLVAKAVLFGDEPDQAVTLGECQHAFAAGMIEPGGIVTLGRVLSGAHPGRADDRQITLFDSTGMALQDLAAAQTALRLALERGGAVELDVNASAPRTG